jgi:hypothetical protein
MGAIMLAWAYFCASLAMRSTPPLRRIVVNRLLRNEKMQKQFASWGVSIPVFKYQSVRYGAATGWLAITYLAGMITGDRPLSLLPAGVTFIFLLLTSTLPLSPLYLWMEIIKRRVELERDGELIALIRLYGILRRRKGMQFAAFVEQAAKYLPALRLDLLSFSQRLTLEGTEKAFLWLESRFPAHHAFVHHVCSLIQAAEQEDEPGLLVGQNSPFLEKMSRDHYERRRKAFSPWINVLNTVPSFLVFLMILMLILQYIGIAKSQISM